MKKSTNQGTICWRGLLPNKFFMVMRLTLGLFLMSCISAFATNSYSQQAKVSLAMSNVKLKLVLTEIEKKSDYYFVYDNNRVDVERVVSIEARNKSIKEVLSRLFVGQSVKAVIVQNQIILSRSQVKRTVVGKVYDNTGSTLPGVSVSILGKNKGTITDYDGKYSIEAEKGDTLSFSFIGYSTKKVALKDETTLDISLQLETKGLDEIVVVGYGAQRKKDLTGSVVSVKTDDLESMNVPSVSDALQGRAAGVQIISSGKPGDDATIRIRGIGTINNSDPLYVIDGVPTDGGLNQLNMADIASIQVLKDASATAIYGSRGANGVVIVSTKKGKAGRERIVFSHYTTLQQVANKIDVLNASEYASLHNEMMQNAGRDLYPYFSDPEALGQGTDWVNAMFRDAVAQNYSLSYSGGNKKTTYYVSANMFNQEGVVLGTGFDRYTVKLNVETKLWDKIKFGNMLSFNHDKKYSGDYDILNTLRALPTLPIYNEDGTYAGPKERPEWDGDITNPVGKATLTKKTTLGYNLLGSFFGEAEIIDGLKLKSSVGLKANFWQERTWSPAYNWSPSPQELSYLYEASNKAITWNWDNTLTYTTSFDDKHFLTAMVGTSAQENQWKNISGSIQDFASDATQQLNNGLSQKQINGTESDWALLSFMGRVNYNFADRYLLTVTLRRDGSSRFGANNKWGTFPSASAAWRVSEEKFFNVPQISNLKVRAGYGITGNQNIGNYAFASSLNIVQYNFNNNPSNAVVPVVMPNPNVRWESQRQTNVGVDIGLFNNRVNVTLDAYYKLTEDMLVPMSVPITTGYSDVYVPSINAGSLENKGVELNVSTVNYDSDFKWTTDFNISVNRNEVVDLNDTIPMARGNVGFNQQIARIEAGVPMDAFFGFVTDGVFQTDEEVEAHATQVPGSDPNSRTSAGDIRYKDLNNDGKIDDNDRTYIGNPNPDFIFSLNNHFQYKGFDLNVYLQGVYGNDIYNANRISNEGMAVAYNQSAETLNRWTGAGTSNSMPRAVFNDPNKNSRPSDRFIEDGSYVRIKNVSLGYTLPAAITKQAYIQKARFYVSTTNLFTFTNYKGFDPEVQLTGIDNNIYPLTRTFSVGVNLNF